MADLGSITSYDVNDTGDIVTVKFVQANPAETGIFIDCGFEPTEVIVVEDAVETYYWNASMPEGSWVGIGAMTAYEAADGFTIVSQADTQPAAGDHIINATTAASGETEISAAELANGKGGCVGVYLGADVDGAASKIMIVTCKK